MKTRQIEQQLLDDREMGERTLHRLMKYVVKTQTCWLWIGQAKTHHGYGKLNVKNVCIRAHRISWLLSHGVIPDDKLVCHTCDNPLCVNPVHLFLGTPKDNMDDMATKGRRVIGQKPSGEQHHNCKLTDEQIVQIRESPLSTAAMAALVGVNAMTILRVRKRIRLTTQETLEKTRG